ncbi:MAG: D-alanyl-D-alanine carboxypeptidase/D-alanyl-D-alanine-endopeptidase [Bdellovibrionaceae bacterium]|nr:D-alanyl-D-alanine carboxypeptidase/D-alanyl-D-alanine-endopeptidase [Pseudobdellovibrionaceae bacterium]|tara:strand:- start:1357 stop:2757 length:1401 start_codon:yes stop_codon:yes gene_type:complete
MKSLFLILLALNVFQFSAQALEASDLQKIIKSYGIPEERLGLYVLDLNTIPHKEILSVRGEEKMIPASLSKILTAVASLKKFGPSYKFKTTLWSTASESGPVVKGDLYLKGGGDPGFVSETLWFLVNEYTRNEVQKIEGNIVVDESYFDSVRFDESRDPERVDRAYDAPIAAMSFNWNSITVHVRPAKLGDSPKIFLNPDNGEWKIINKAKTKKGKSAAIRVSRVGADTIYVTGWIGQKSDEVVKYKSILAPAMWAGNNLKAFLAHRGITVTGDVKLGKVPTQAHLVAEAEGKPMRETVSDMMKFSNNYVAEMLTKNLAAKYKKQPGTMDDGVGIIKEVIEDLGISGKNFHFQNPSGLSRANVIRPKDMTQILSEAYGSFGFSSEFLSSLPLAGVDGTLKKRMVHTAAEGRVRAKTGMLTGVAGLAGFAGRKDGQVYAFTFLFNGPGPQGDLARRLFDDLAARLVK